MRPLVAMYERFNVNIYEKKCILIIVDDVVPFHTSAPERILHFNLCAPEVAD